LALVTKMNDFTLKHYKLKMGRKAEQFNHKMFMPLYFEDMIGDQKEVNVAELGSAMFCTIGNLWNGTKINIYPSDILADEFNQMLKEANIKPLIPVLKEDMENLTYPDNFFDIVHCVNALDHTKNPFKALQEMKRVCKKGGWIYLRHFSCVGEIEGYAGDHQWNIEARAGDVTIWNKQIRYYLSDIFPKLTTEVKIGREWSYEPKDMVIIKIQNEKV